MKIKLWDSVGTGLIIPCKSGIIYSNQTGGTTCLQMELEGAYMPLANDVSNHNLMSKENDLFEYFSNGKWGGCGATNGLEQDDADFIDGLFSDYLWSLKVDRTKLKESHEAWVWVIFSETENLPILETEFPCKAILTWTNSD